MSFIDRLVDLWQLSGRVPDPSLADKAIRKFQNRFDVQLPPDVDAFYRRFHSLLGDMDSDLNHFWPIEDVDIVSAKVAPCYSGVDRITNSTELFAFADHSIWVHVYAMRLSKDSRVGASVIWIADGEFATLAETFAGFWEIYLASTHHIVVP